MIRIAIQSVYLNAQSESSFTLPGHDVVVHVRQPINFPAVLRNLQPIKPSRLASPLLPTFQLARHLASSLYLTSAPTCSSLLSKLPHYPSSSAGKQPTPDSEIKSSQPTPYIASIHDPADPACLTERKAAAAFPLRTH
ncbi:hypothetical protein BDV95DRAFT_280679 [Massariosphaeria phaeospora]|uniref:Uncharacterized protein n=1 Tax=Massariosphaeria phaeospora TaxID=100035 RepID=A0A7C8MFM2_9PLEO|nr:hypothetical protein BDV95DRAFT_280679 [Massariosphaeria phaeospora]